MKTLNVIGCGKAGKTLCRLWSENGVFRVVGVVNSSLESSRSAVSFIGSGTAVESIATLTAADVTMISAADSAIEELSRKLALSQNLLRSSVAFHISGSLTSDILNDLRKKGVHCCSVHPAMSFAEPAVAISQFPGVRCTAEGDATAVSVVTDAFARIGAVPVRVRKEDKAQYHIATVMVSNYCTALIGAGIDLLVRNGFEEDSAKRILQPLGQAALTNTFTLGAKNALTGPISRGEVEVVRGHLNALIAGPHRELYLSLATATVELARKQGSTTDGALEEILALLSAAKKSPADAGLLPKAEPSSASAQKV